jgi:hypothetical protein
MSRQFLENSLAHLHSPQRRPSCAAVAREGQLNVRVLPPPSHEERFGSRLSRGPTTYILRQLALAQDQSWQHDPASAFGATHERMNYVAKNAFRDKMPPASRAVAQTLASLRPMRQFARGETKTLK